MTTPDSAEENWRVIPKFPRYEISDLGRIRYSSMNRIIGQSQSASGLRATMVNRNGVTIVAHVQEISLAVWPSKNHHLVGGFKRDTYTELERAQLSGSYNSGRWRANREEAA